MINLPNIPVNTAATLATGGVLFVTAFIVKKKSEDVQHLVNSHTEALKIDAEKQATMLTSIQALTNPKI